MYSLLDFLLFLIILININVYLEKNVDFSSINTDNYLKLEVLNISLNKGSNDLQNYFIVSRCVENNSFDNFLLKYKDYYLENFSNLTLIKYKELCIISKK